MNKVTIIIVFCMVVFVAALHSQQNPTTSTNKLIVAVDQDRVVPVFDSVKYKKIKKDSLLLASHKPRIATQRSALIPGWGQAYNREYWKIPIVYGVLAIPAVAYIYNTNLYKRTKFAYEARFNEQNGDSSGVAAIHPDLKGLSIGSLQNYRNSFRRDRDYSILWFILAWGLQVADATVFAHLKHFDVSNDLSMQIQPQFNPNTKTPALTLSFNWRDKPKKSLLNTK